MPIHSPWRPANADHVRLNVPEESGVYELKSFGNLVYVGKATNLRGALLEHLDERSPNYYRIETPDLLGNVDEMYDKHLNRYDREHGGLPAWNESERTVDEDNRDDVAPGEDEAMEAGDT